MAIIILAILFVVIGGFFLNALLLNLTTKLFKVENFNYKSAVKITLLSSLLSLALALLLSVIKSSGLSAFISVVGGFFIFHKLLNKFYVTKLKKNIGIYLLYVIFTATISLAIIIPIRSFVFEPYYITGQSMAPTLKDKDYFFLRLFNNTYKRGDIIVFRNPKDPKQYFVERIIALPGEKVQLKNGSVYIFNKENPTGFLLKEDYLSDGTKTWGYDEDVLEVKNDEYYTLGDNRNASMDSRTFGAFSKQFIVGKFWIKPL